jgi:uncharacterized protein (UPF0332 family)
MREDNWDDCLKDFSSRKVTPDPQKAKSLIETADERIECTNKDLNEKTANFIFEDYYSSILELAQAILLLEGYNVGNHICVGFYLRDELKKEELFRIFDDLRFKRNSLVYYGQRMEFEICKLAIEKSKKLIVEFHKIINSKLL